MPADGLYNRIASETEEVWMDATLDPARFLRRSTLNLRLNVDETWRQGKAEAARAVLNTSSGSDRCSVLGKPPRVG